MTCCGFAEGCVCASCLDRQHADQREYDHYLSEQQAQYEADMRTQYEADQQRQSTLDAEERWYALHDGWVGPH